MKAIVSPAFSFIDLFAGIGGTRLGFEAAGGECVFSSEWNKFAAKTYLVNHGEVPAGDITKTAAADIPPHDVLLAGFPCQPFSIAGVTKHRALGNADGFLHKTQGTLFFEVARLLKYHRPRAFLLENVRNLVSHNRGDTFRTILGTLRDDLGYEVHWSVIDAAAAVPQHRERIYIVGFRDPADFRFPTFPPRSKRLRDILEREPEPKYRLTRHLWEYLQDYAAKHRAKGNGFGFGLVDLSDDGAVTRTLSARYYKDGSEILIPTDGSTPRRLTPRECARLMGFPESFKIPVSDTQAYHQFGNSVVVPVITAIAQEIVASLSCQNESPYPVRSPNMQPRLLALSATGA